jgi:hypothetical protein
MFIHTGYDIPEKVAIATRYLVPKALKDAGLQTEEGTFACMYMFLDLHVCVYIHVIAYFYGVFL